MVEVKSVKIDGESIRIFNSAIYIYETIESISLQLDVVVSEVTVNRYRGLDNLIVEIELEDGRLVNSIMHVNSLSGGLPQLNLYVELEDMLEYGEFPIVNENDASFPNIEEGITLEEIRKVEMPDVEVKLKLKLPIDQAEWLMKQKKAALNELFKEFIYDYWKK
ncbi:hypothetical protein [Neobacillus kokaensis]|uniref:Uncharacterized protein n=1 Tax=Neobacillus kokaensis TaxID=2759023 RepID=A0ABQ3N469_9BACI|nr:hypothetical protein [Neobacillus kokaensis]GHH98944.1 hypothetical protein AM1BK_24870 [Neobacillus kokaensis]